MIACDCRVSSRHQKTDSQKAEILRWLISHGVNSAEVEWFEDHETGRSLQRSGFDALQRSIFDGRTTTVVVWKLDRLSRRLKEGINLLADWCDQGIRIVSVTQQIDLSGPLGQMVAGVMFGLAEIEWEYRRERQAAGIRVAKLNGIYRGRRRGTTKAFPNRACELQQRGLTRKEIAKALGVSERTVFRLPEQRRVNPTRNVSSNSLDRPIPSVHATTILTPAETVTTPPGSQSRVGANWGAILAMRRQFR